MSYQSIMENLLLFLLVPSGIHASIPRRYHFVNQPKNWTEAQQYCRENYTDLATVSSIQETETIVEKANGYNGTAWIGLFRSWRWSADDSELNYTNWEQSDSQDEDESCAIMDSDGMWRHKNCNKKFSFMCYPEHNHNDKTVVAQTWAEARNHCRSRDMNLVSVKNSQDNQNIKNEKNHKDIWLGLYLNDWRWSDNSNSSFRLWLQKEPNNMGEKLYCATALMGNEGKWTDSNCNQKLQFICYEEKLVLIRKNLTWREAHSYCQQHHVGLVSVPSSEVDVWVKMTARSATTAHVWLGLYHLCGPDFWFWVESGETLCYDRWAKGSGGNEGCSRASGAIESGGNHHWVSRNETDKLNFICTTF